MLPSPETRQLAYPTQKDGKGRRGKNEPATVVLDLDPDTEAELALENLVLVGFAHSVLADGAVVGGDF